MTSWDEDGLHRWLAEQDWPKALVGSRGHDAAVLAPVDGRLALCADQCIEGVHFRMEAGGRAVGRKAVLRTLSDLAATAAKPIAVTMTLKAPGSMEGVDLGVWLRAALTGARDAAAEYGAELVAGDLAMGEGPIALSVSALGRVPGGLRPVGRDRADAGQWVLLSGPVGGSLPSGRHLEPRPRIQAGIAAAAFGATAMMDVSDGLAWDLYRLARASGVRIRLDAERVAIHSDAHAAATSASEGPGTKRDDVALDYALRDGEDHELIATMAASAWDTFKDSPDGAEWHVIGEVVSAGETTNYLDLNRGGTLRPWKRAPAGGWTYGSPATDRQEP